MIDFVDDDEHDDKPDDVYKNDDDDKHDDVYKNDDDVKHDDDKHDEDDDGKHDDDDLFDLILYVPVNNLSVMWFCSTEQRDC